MSHTYSPLLIYPHTQRFSCPSRTPLSVAKSLSSLPSNGVYVIFTRSVCLPPKAPSIHTTSFLTRMAPCRRLRISSPFYTYSVELEPTLLLEYNLRTLRVHLCACFAPRTRRPKTRHWGGRGTVDDFAHTALLASSSAAPPPPCPNHSIASREGIQLIERESRQPFGGRQERPLARIPALSQGLLPAPRTHAHASPTIPNRERVDICSCEKAKGSRDS